MATTKHSLIDRDWNDAGPERRWFAALSRAEWLRRECALLREVAATAEANWREALGQLQDLEALCAQLGEEYLMSQSATERPRRRLEDIPPREAILPVANGI